MKTIYLWTGEYRPPKKGEWFLEGVVQTGMPLLRPQECFIENWAGNVFILDRQEQPEPDGGE